MRRGVLGGARRRRRSRTGTYLARTRLDDDDDDVEDVQVLLSANNYQQRGRHGTLHYGNTRK